MIRRDRVEQAKEQHRDARSFPWLEDVRRDVPYAIRGLVRTPGFTAAAVLTLGLGIGATTTILGVVDAVLLRPLPYPESDRLVHINEVAPPPEPGKPAPPRNITYAQFVEWRAQTTMAPVAAVRWDPQVMAPTPRGTARLSGGLVSPEWFELLGRPATLGRTLLPSDVAEGRNVVSPQRPRLAAILRVRPERARDVDDAPLANLDVDERRADGDRRRDAGRV